MSKRKSDYGWAAWLAVFAIVVVLTSIAALRAFGQEQTFPVGPRAFLWGTNMYYIDGISGNDATAQMGSAYLPAKTWNFACTNLQAKFPGGSYVIAAHGQQFSNSPAVNGSGWTVINISNSFAIFGNNCTLHSVSNSHFFVFSCTNLYVKDVIFSTTNNVQSAANRQGYWWQQLWSTNASWRFDNVFGYGTIDGVFDSGASGTGTMAEQFNNCQLLSGWNVFVNGLASQSGFTNYYREFNGCTIRSDPELINVWGSGRVATLNSLGTSQAVEEGGTNWTVYKFCTLENQHGTNAYGFSVCTSGTAAGGLQDFKQCTFLGSPSANAQETNIVGTAGMTYRFWNCAITNAQSIWTNGATVVRMSTTF